MRRFPDCVELALLGRENPSDSNVLEACSGVIHIRPGCGRHLATLESIHAQVVRL